MTEETGKNPSLLELEARVFERFWQRFQETKPQIKTPKHVLLAAFAAGLIAGYFLAHTIQPYSSYEDCVLDKLKEAKTTSAVNLMRHACQKLY